MFKQDSFKGQFKFDNSHMTDFIWDLTQNLKDMALLREHKKAFINVHNFLV